MAHIERSITIDATPEDVFTVLTDLDRLPDWSTVTVETHDTPEGGLRNSQTFRQTLRILGRNVEAEWRVEDLQAPNSIAYTATGPGGAALRMAQHVRAEGNGCRVELDLDYELPAGFAGAALNRAYLERRNEREVEHSLQNLKELVETGAVQ